MGLIKVRREKYFLLSSKRFCLAVKLHLVFKMTRSQKGAIGSVTFGSFGGERVYFFAFIGSQHLLSSFSHARCPGGSHKSCIHTAAFTPAKGQNHPAPLTPPETRIFSRKWLKDIIISNDLLIIISNKRKRDFLRVFNGPKIHVCAAINRF